MRLRKSEAVLHSVKNQAVQSDSLGFNTSKYGKRETRELRHNFVSKPHRRRPYISIQTRRRALESAQYQCQYIDPVTKRRCDCRFGLEIDHLRPRSLGGTDELGNLRALCVGIE